MTPHNADHITPSNPIRVTYDDEVQILYIYFQEPRPGISKRTVSIDYGIHMDLDENDNPVGIEIPLDDTWGREEGLNILKKHFNIRKQKW